MGTVTRRRLMLFVLGTFVVLGGSALAYATTRSSASLSSTLTYTWAMPERIGADRNADGLVDYDTSTAYLNPTSWKVDLDACSAPAITDRGPGTQVTWTFSGAALATPVNVTGTCKLTQTLPKLGTYTVAAKLTSDATVNTSQPVTLKDVFIVSVGDSVASGEGDPDTLGPKDLGPFPFYTPKWEDQQCHRSALAGPAQAAIRLEQRDPHTSVTFLHLACSGATIDVGLLGPYEGIEPKIDGQQLPKKPAQLDDAVNLAHGRKIDSLFVSIGANNMGFADIVKTCIAVQNCNTAALPNGVDNAQQIYDKGIAKLPPLYQQLDQKLTSMSSAGQLGKVFMTQYFDVSQFDDGTTCTGQTPNERAGYRNPDSSVIDGFSQSEMQWTHDVVSPGINKAVADAVAAANADGGPKWTVVDHIADDFLKHGYCAKDRWIRQLFESFAYQHDQNGAFHPNTEGQLYGYAKNIERVVAPVDGFGGDPVPFALDPRVGLSGDAVSSYLGVLDSLNTFEELANAAPFGARDVVNKGYQKLFSWLATAQAKVQQLSTQAGETITKLDNELDDIDGDGDPTSDVHGIPGLTADLEVDISPKQPAKAYDVAISLRVTLDQNGPLAWLADGLSINGQQAGNDLSMNFATTLHIDPLAAKKITIPANGVQLGRIGLAVDATFAGDSNPLAFHAGLLDVSATGSVKADAGIAATLVDPNNDGVIDATEMNNPAALLKISCGSTGANVDLTVNGSFAGLGAKVGHIGLADTNVCDGLSAPDVELGDLAQFRNLTLGDLINGLAQVTQSVKAAQAAGDLDIPFVKEPLSAFVNVNDRLIKFFVDNGFTDPANPMANITVDTSKDAALQSLQQLAPKLATALGLPENALNMRYDSGRILFTLQAATDPAAAPNTASLDFGNSLKSTGITGFVGGAKATVDPKFSLDLGFGFDLSPGLPLDQRFFLTNGSKGNIISLDADVTADVDVTAVLSVLGVNLKDSNPSGAVPLLQRKDLTKPMVSVSLVDPNNDGRVTLAELAASFGTKALPVTASINATVPKTDLTVTANAVGIPLAAGKVSVAWPAVPDLTGAGALTVTVDDQFLNNALPFAFDTSDPKALIGKLLTATRETVTRVRSAIASGDVTTTTPLPLVGKSVADLEPVLVKVQSALDDLIAANNLLTLDALQHKMDEILAQALGSPANQPVPDLVSLSFEPRTASTQAAIVVSLKLGACSTDRAANRTGCTVTGAPLDVPFNLQLGSGSKAGGVAGLGTSGAVKVSYDARANLTFGVLLPNVTAGATSTDLPKPSGVPTLFVQDNSGFDVGLGVKLDGIVHAGLGPIQVDLGTSTDKAQAAIAARFAMKSASPTGKRMAIGSTELTNWLTSLLPKTGAVTVHETDATLQATCPGVTGTVDACAVLPVYVGTTKLGNIAFKAPDLLTPSGWTFDSAQVESNLTNEAIQFSLIVDGVRTLAAQLEQGLRNLPAGTKIPLLGADVTAGADVIKAFNDNVLGKLQELSDALSAVGTTGTAKAKVQELLGQLPILSSGGTVTVTATCRTDAGTVVTCVGTEPISKLQSLEVRLPLHVGVAGATRPFDLGFPGLRLASEGKVQGAAGLDLNLAFGIDRDLGFYVPTAGAQPELALTATAALPNLDGTPDLTGELAFLPIAIEDTHAGSDVNVSAGINLTSKRADNRLTLQDLGAADFTPSIQASANVHLGVSTTKPNGALSFLPTFHADLNVDASVQWSGASGTSPQVTAGINFANVSVDAGSLVRDFIKPVARELHQYTQPLEKPIDTIRQPIPGVSEAAKLAGKPAISWYDAFKAIDDATRQPGQTSGLQMIDRVIKLVDMVKALDNPDAPTGEIPLGSFTVLPSVASNPLPLSEADKLVGSSSVSTPDVISKLTFTGSDKLAEATSTGGLTFPAFQHPTQLFQLLLGKDVPLVYFDAGKLSVKRGFQFAYPIGPARLYIGGSAELSGHFAIGYDTYGLRKALDILTDDDPTNDGFWDVTKGLLQGVYLDDNDQAGNDVPEIEFAAELTAGASVGIPGLEAGAEGGIHGDIQLNLHTDPEQSGKVRYTDIANQLAVNPNPLCFFDASAKVDAFIRAYVKSPFGTADYPIASRTVYEQKDLTAFCHTQQNQQPHLLADLATDGTLTLKTDETAQSVDMTQTAAGTVQISANGIVESYEGVRRVIADLKGGGDRLDLHQGGGVTAALPAVICGGAGDDRISADTGPVQLYGDGGAASCAVVGSADAGSDTLATGPGADKLDGGPGDDALDGGPGSDTLTGGEGNDVLRSGLGDDTIAGGAGDDTTDYGDHSTPVSVTLPGPSGSTGESDTASEVENVYGGTANDTVTLPASGSFRVDGGIGDDTINSGKSTGLLMGSDGDDTFVGGAGNAMIVAGAGNDTFVDGPGSQTFIGEGGTDTADYGKAPKSVTVTIDGEANDGPVGAATDDIIDADVVIGSAFDDHLTGGSAGEELRGGLGADHLEGGPGADTLLGGGDADVLDGNAGADTVKGEAGADTLHGGLGPDDLSGGTEVDLADYADRTDNLVITKDDAANDGAASDTWKDNVRTDVEKIVGGSGDDHIEGYAGADALEGGPGRDVLYGLTGADTFVGGPGNDEMYDITFNSRFDYTGDGASDTFVGGDGADYAYGGGGTDQFDMGAGVDNVYAGAGADTIHGGDGDDQLHGGASNDVIEGDAGDDNIWGDDGDDLLKGGTSVTGLSTIWGGNGNDTIYTGLQGGSVYAGVSGGSDETDAGPNTIYGYAGDRNFYTGSAGPDSMHLGAGNDIVHAYLGNDVVELGDGANTAYGDGGDDVITGGANNDVIYGNDGNDTLYGGAGQDILQGIAGNDELHGGADDDGLDGGPGDDLLDGGTQADRMDGSEGADTVTYAGRTEPVAVKENGNFTDGGASDQSSKAGSSNVYDYVDYDVEKLVGGSGNDSFSIGSTLRTGTALLDGGAGDDSLVTRSTTPTTFVGGPGNDALQGGSGADTFVQGSVPDGADDMHGGAGVDVADYSARPAGTAYLTLDDVANDGAGGERDNVHVDVENSLGTVGGGPPTPAASVAALKVTEGAPGTKTVANLTVSLSTAANDTVTVPWSVVSGNALAGRDFVAANGTLTIQSGGTRATIPVTVLGDALDEVDEYATVKLGPPAGATLGTSSAKLTIADDDAAPKVSVHAAAVAEGPAGTKTALKFSLTLSAASGKTVTVHVATADGTAKAGSDYAAKSATITFAPGEKSKVFAVTVLGDRAREANEALYAVLTKPVNVTLGTARVTGTIRNDD
ncbi:MAG TPA: Calx-beta domain-containing protein [Jatrophihabitans sp.]|nr:Calx-beta domain-containing protein [Jatrophihabitans sp.]